MRTPCPLRLGSLRSRGEAGSVTAEAAVALPALVVVLLASLAGLAAMAGQVRCVDAARAGARVAARGEPDTVARAAAAQAAPDAAVVSLSRAGGLVRVEVRARVSLGPRLGSVTLAAAAVAADEAAWGAPRVGR